MATYEQCFQWQCQYCTFINSKEVAMQTFQSRVICDICGKSTAWTDVMQKQQLTDKQKPVPKPRKLTRLKPSDHQNRSLEEADLDKSWNTRRAAADLTDEGSDGINWFSRYSRSRMSERSTLPSRREYLEHALSPSDEGATGYSESSSSGLELFKRSFKDKTFSAYQRSRAVHNSSLRTSGERKNVQSPAKVVVGECPVCTEDKLLLEVPFCRCAVCSDCLCQQIEVRLNNSSSVSGLTCPVCDKLDNEALTDTSCEYFAQLQSLLIGKLKPGVMAKLDERLRDWRLKLTDNFCWCSGCSNGFEVSEHHDRQVRCPQCRKETCRKCGKAWHEQHRGVSCQQFADWRERADAGERGLAEFLQSRGSSCPKCGLKFEVSRGGCLHITCTRCKAEFCSDCGSPFVREECCGGTKGLHCHHGKECVVTFRDWSIEKVRQAALEKGVQLDRFSGSSGSQCRVKEQKDTAGGRLVDEECGKPAIESGMCEFHYKEVLASAMRRKKSCDAAQASGMPQTTTLRPILKSAFAKRPEQLNVSFYNQKQNDFPFNLKPNSESVSRESHLAHGVRGGPNLANFVCPHCTAVSPSAVSASSGSRLICTVCGKSSASDGSPDCVDYFKHNSMLMNLPEDVDLQNMIGIFDD